MSTTWSDILDKLEREHMLESEDWIDEDELMGYGNDAVREAEAIILGLYEDYFLDYAPITFVAGTDEYSLPTGIYANKIRRFLFDNGSKRYVIRRVRDWHKFEEKMVRDALSSSAEYEYFIASPTAGADAKIVVSPTIRSEDAGANGKLWFIREANRFTTSSDVCDIPEFMNFIYAHMKVQIYAKEGHPLLGAAVANLQKQQSLMEATLSETVPDADNEIEPDLEWYEEMN